MGDLSEHFSSREFACKHCGQVKVHPSLLAGLERFRALTGGPVIVLSGYRCPEHNAAVGGAPQSEHVEGTAADVEVPGWSLADLYQVALQVPEFHAGGIGLYDGGFLHLDVRGIPARWSRVNGRYGPIEALL